LTAKCPLKACRLHIGNLTISCLVIVNLLNDLIKSAIAIDSPFKTYNIATNSFYLFTQIVSLIC